MPDYSQNVEPSFFVDIITRTLALTAEQNSELQASVKLGQGLESASLLLHVVTQANIFKLQNTIEELFSKNIGSSQILTELKGRLTESWSLNEEHKVKELEANKQKYNLESAFRNETRRKTLTKQLRAQVNNNKGTFRCTLLKTATAQHSLGIVFTGNNLLRFTGCVALFRRYIRESGVNDDSRDGEKEKKDDTFFKGFQMWLGNKIMTWGSNFDTQEWRVFLAETQALEEEDSVTTIAPPPVVENSMTLNYMELSNSARPIIPLPQRARGPDGMFNIPGPGSSFTTPSRLPSFNEHSSGFRHSQLLSGSPLSSPDYHAFELSGYRSSPTASSPLACFPSCYLTPALLTDSHQHSSARLYSID
ncbi:hypothetical protein GYMLUDRAFT_248081 [Collybiopsis luxurians FD-317 M1]|uniref:Uncharacterized protein n=1 Tax=Collybiopsis luxurians FD-317 M1 TaxID=944289 RepID=A0A0D0AZD0_9AGAR|nr:hypothetical protein GYMLUDRAFT_248081 [Collybiopsis luxurians FD-317 M1]